MPAGVVPQMGTDWSPVGQIYFYTLESTNPEYDVMNLKSLETWVVEKNLKSVPGVVDINPFGGPTREYQVRLDPDKLIDYGLSISQVEQQLANNNANAGGSFIQEGQQQVNVREVGLVKDIQDIGNTVVTTKGGTPVRVKDLAEVTQGPQIRLGQFGRSTHLPDGRIIDNDDVVSGIAALQKGANAQPTLNGIHQKVKELNDLILPKGVKIAPFIDRSDLLHFTTHTVLHNLTEGMVLVVGHSLSLSWKRARRNHRCTHDPIFAAVRRHLSRPEADSRQPALAGGTGLRHGGGWRSRHGRKHCPPSRTQGRKRAPDPGKNRRSRPRSPAPGFLRHRHHHYRLPAYLHAAGGRGSLVPAHGVDGGICTAWRTDFFHRSGSGPFQHVLQQRRKGVEKPGDGVPARPLPARRPVGHSSSRPHHRRRGRRASPSASISQSSGVIGSEFLPHLDEGSLWVRGELDQSAGPDDGIRVANEARLILCSFPEATDCTSQTGRPDDGTDHTGFFNTEFFVGLKPKEEWRPIFHQDKDNLIAAMNLELTKKFPGVSWGFSQPIEDNMEEAVSGVKGELATKVYGNDLHVLEDEANQVAAIMSHVRGITDLGVLNVTGQPDLDYVVDRQAAARWQINVADIQDAIQTAVGGTALTQVLRGEQVYNLTLRYLPQYRDTRASDRQHPSAFAFGRAGFTGPALHSQRSGRRLRNLSRKQPALCRHQVQRPRTCPGRRRERSHPESRRAGKASARLSHCVGGRVPERSARREARMLIIVPLTVLLIFIILYSMYKSFKWAILILATVAMASIGGLLVLLITRTNFSVSSEVGFLALFGVSVQTGVIMLEYINQLRARGNSIEEAAVEGAVLRLRPIMMTMLVATLGSAACGRMSHGIGSDSQRPFAIVIVGGLIADLVMSIFLLAYAVRLDCQRQRCSSRSGNAGGQELTSKMRLDSEDGLTMNSQTHQRKGRV